MHFIAFNLLVIRLIVSSAIIPCQDRNESDPEIFRQAITGYFTSTVRVSGQEELYCNYNRQSNKKVDKVFAID